MARRRKPVITHAQVMDRLKRMEDTINEALKCTTTFDVQALVAERDYWKAWAINNGWAHGDRAVGTGIMEMIDNA